MLLEDYLAQNDIHVVVYELPASVRAFSVRCGCGYLVALNSALSDAVQRRALRHELCHIALGDDGCPLSVCEIEKRTRALLR